MPYHPIAAKAPMKEMGNPIATHTAKDGRKNKENQKHKKESLKGISYHHLQRPQVVGAVLPDGHADPLG